VTVNVAPGTYKNGPDNEYFNVFLYNVNGTAANPVVFQPWAGKTGYIILVSAHDSTATGLGISDNAISIYNSHYVTVNGFTTENGSGALGTGVFMYSSTHITVTNSNIWGMQEAGIGAVYSDYISVTNNQVIGCAAYASTMATETSGITFWEFINSNPSDTSIHNYITNNYSYGNLNKFGNDTEGHGIILDTMDTGNPKNPGMPNGLYGAKTLISNNLCYGNGGAGISIWYSNNAIVRCNTAYSDWTDPNITSYSNKGEIQVINGNNCTLYDNIAYAIPGNGPAGANNVAFQDWDNNWPTTNTGNVWQYNLSFNGTSGQTSVSTETGGPQIIGQPGNILGSDPQFVGKTSSWPPGNGFYIGASSPAKNAGTYYFYYIPSYDLANNPLSSIIDLGAYTYQ
jgi:parallel beta-helix repeat protein